jgi:alkanesulfonate monooxygenase SsuD/methylene tetrahydromethanopterin reductase-like flavin-dependent oxidoreductase (luciferase family)
VDFGGRGRAFERQLGELNRLWSGEGGVGPPPARGARPTVLVGGGSDAAYRRAAEHADGWTMGGGPPEAFAEALRKLREAWQAAGRDGEPRTMALFYFALGDDAEQVAARSLGDYYAFLGDYAARVADSAATDAETVREYLAAYEQAGVDEVICFPASTDPAQVELLASAAGL